MGWGLTPAGFIPQQAPINCSESVKGDGGGMEEWGIKRDGERVKGRKDEMRMLA